MLNVLVPKNHFLTINYPLMEDYVLGLSIPLGWGNIHDVVPFCIDTVALRFKLVDQHVDITEVRSKGIVLNTPGSYVAYPTIAEFVLEGTPYFAGGATCYFAVSGTYPISLTDYLQFRTLGNALHTAYTIDGAGVGSTWTPLAGRTLGFNAFGKQTLAGTEEQIHQGLGNAPAIQPLRNVAANTRLGDSFVVPAPGYFLTRIQVFLYTPPQVGTPIGETSVTTYSSLGPGLNAEVQEGMQGDQLQIITGQAVYSLTLPQAGEDADLVADIESPFPMLTTGAEIIEDLFINTLDKDILDATWLADFGVSRTQMLKVFIDREMTVGDFIGKMEATLLWKFIPLQDGATVALKYAPVAFGGVKDLATAPAYHFRDEDFLDFRMEHDLSTVRNIVRVKYDEAPDTQEFKIATAQSDYARLFYSCEDTVEIETWLTGEGESGSAFPDDAEDLARAYMKFFMKPQARITFRVHGFGLNLLPGRDKVRLTRSRAMWQGGAINGDLFRIMRLVKSPATNSTEMTAILDDDTIPDFDISSGSL